MDLKAISIRQPWADLVARGIKPFENRSRCCNYRGALLVHAGKIFDADGYRHLNDIGLGMYLKPRSEYLFGGIVGRVEMVGCVRPYYLESSWATGPWCFVFKNAEELPFVAVRGQLAVPFTVDEAVIGGIRGRS